MIITIAHTKGGVGKSTLAWHLAHSYKDEKVTVIDLDFQQTLHYINLLSHKNLHVIQSQSVSQLILQLEQIKKDDICIIDVGGFDNDINRAAIERSDKVLVPISDSVTEVLGFKTFEKILDELDTHAELNVVLNNAHPLTTNFRIIKKAISSTRFRLLDTIVRNRKIYKTTMGNGESVFNTKKTNPLARIEIQGVRDELRSY